MVIGLPTSGRVTQPRIARFYAKCEVSDSIIDMRNGNLMALLILQATQLSRESHGYHCRID